MRVPRQGLPRPVGVHASGVGGGHTRLGEGERLPHPCEPHTVTLSRIGPGSGVLSTVVVDRVVVCVVEVRPGGQVLARVLARVLVGARRVGRAGR